MGSPLSLQNRRVLSGIGLTVVAVAAWFLPTGPALSARHTTVNFESDGRTLQGYLCLPEALGPLPAVIYNHGGLGNVIGGAPEETCQAIARAGYVGFAPIRRKEIPIPGHLSDIQAAVNYVKQLDTVDKSRIGIIGFSRGGLLSFLAATEMPADFRAVVLMAPAPPQPKVADSFYAKARLIDAPVLLLVAENDTPSHNQEGQDHVALAKKLRDSILQAGKQVRLILYPPYGANGHRMFFEVGEYWRDVQAFLEDHLKRESRGEVQ